jgi:apolipoprotein N-acyltransferase
MENIDDQNLRKPGEMFTASILKKATPPYQFLFSMGLSLLFIFLSKFALKSNEMMMYSGCFGVVFYVMFNPWLALLTDDNKKYIVTSLIFYSIIAVVLYGLIYLWTGKFVDNSMEVRITLITTTFYLIVAYGMMMALKYLFVDQSGGGL